MITKKTIIFASIIILSIFLVLNIPVDYLACSITPVACKFFDVMDSKSADAIKSKFDELSFTEKQTASTAQKAIVDLVQRLAAKGFIKINS